jgi:hypothetical protein
MILGKLFSNKSITIKEKFCVFDAQIDVSSPEQALI